MAASITCRLVSLTDAADILAVSTPTVRRYIADACWYGESVCSEKVQDDVEA
ncbi:MAG: hypothetical protein M3P83_05585 [Actinomycetota bacterium]|nr:hypothetical protein [Actinomycetota bacterium]